MSPTALIDKMRELKEISEKQIRLLKEVDEDTLPPKVKPRFVDNRIGAISFLEDKIQYYNKVVHIIETGEI